MSTIMNRIAMRIPHRMSGNYSIKSRWITTRAPNRLSSYPTSIRPSDSEIQNAHLSPQHLEIAIRSLHQDGLVVVENVVPHDVLDHLNEKMIQDAYTLQARKTDSPYNYNPGNIQQDAPPMKKYFDSKIFMSESSQKSLVGLNLLTIQIQ